MLSIGEMLSLGLSNTGQLSSQEIREFAGHNGKSLDSGMKKHRKMPEL